MHFIRQALTAAGAVACAPLFAAGTGFRNPNLIRPPALRPGDTVGLVAPAGIVYDPKDFDRMEAVLRSMDLRVRFGRHVRNRHGYLAGHDEERVEDLNRFFADPGIHAVMAVRGGWGSNRILPKVDFYTIRNQPKIFCGFSDITSLHLSILRRCDLVTFHGPNGASDWTDYTRENFRKIVFGEAGRGLELPVPEPDRESRLRVIVPGRAEGPLIGGNLTLVTSLIGTPYMPDLSGAILFVEDIGEDIYRIDRMLSQLALSGVLDGLNGFIFGRCTDCRAGNRPSLTLEQVLKGVLEPRFLPSFYGARISHEADNLTIPVGIRARMDAEEGLVQLLDTPVERGRG